jgi:hypothetical protein
MRGVTLFLLTPSMGGNIRDTPLAAFSLTKEGFEILSFAWARYLKLPGRRIV